MSCADTTAELISRFFLPLPISPTGSGTLFAWLGIASKVGKDSGIPDAGKVVAKSLKPMDTDPPEGP